MTAAIPPEWVTKVNDEIHQYSSDLIACSPRLPQAMPKQKIGEIILRHAPKDQGWIKCDETLPPRGSRALVYAGYRGVVLAVLYNDGWEAIDGNDHADPIRATHWQPLPLPPTEDKKS
jgi:hypothetical protein